MANQAYEVVRAKHATVADSSVDTVTFTGHSQGLHVINRDASAVLSVRWDGQTPTSLGDDSYAVMPGASFIIPTTVETIQVTGSAACAYSVQGID